MRSRAPSEHNERAGAPEPAARGPGAWPPSGHLWRPLALVVLIAARYRRKNTPSGCIIITLTAISRRRPRSSLPLVDFARLGEVLHGRSHRRTVILRAHGRVGPVMAFVHPNPMDQSCWIFQMAHMSTWFRCIAIDIPGYGRSPKARDGLTMKDMAGGCWEAIEMEFPKEPAILVGCSVGSAILPYMHHARPSKTKALIMCGTGYNPGKEFTGHRIKQYTDRGIGYRWDYTFEDLSPAFRQTPLAMYFAEMFAERNAQADLDAIVR